MTLRRIAVPALVAWLVDSVYGFLVFGLALNGEFTQYPAVFRSFEAVNAMMPMLLASSLVGFIAITYIFANLGSDHPGIIEALAQARAEGRDGDLPKLIICPHEMVALSAAHAYSLVSGDPSAVIVCHATARTSHSLTPGRMKRSAASIAASVMALAIRRQASSSWVFVIFAFIRTS